MAVANRPNNKQPTENGHNFFTSCSNFRGEGEILLEIEIKESSSLGFLYTGTTDLASAFRCYPLLNTTSGFVLVLCAACSDTDIQINLY
jgi:hypothetical protein